MKLLKKELRVRKDLLPEKYVQMLSDEKAKAVRPPPFPKSKKINFVIGSDTIVDYDGDILEKPLDQNDANRMLSNLSGKWHKVHTGVAIHAYYGDNLETIVMGLPMHRSSVEMAKLGQKLENK